MLFTAGVGLGFFLPTSDPAVLATRGDLQSSNPAVRFFWTSLLHPVGGYEWICYEMLKISLWLCQNSY